MPKNLGKMSLVSRKCGETESRFEAHSRVTHTQPFVMSYMVYICVREGEYGRVAFICESVYTCCKDAAESLFLYPILIPVCWFTQFIED